MEFVKPQVDLIRQKPGIKGMYKQCELVGRVCYNSADKATPESYKDFIATQIKRNHMSPFEAGTVYLSFPIEGLSDMAEFFKQNVYSFAVFKDGMCHVTTNYRVILENDLQQFMEMYWQDDDLEYHMPRICFKIDTNIEVYKEITRHRALSPMIESTRFCNYAKDRFSHCVKFTLPNWLGYKSNAPEDEKEWLADRLHIIESFYFEAQELWGWDAQRAAYLLPQGTKATTFFTGFIPDWEWFLTLRYEQKTGPVRPDMLEISTEVANILKELGYYSAE